MRNVYIFVYSNEINSEICNFNVKVAARTLGDLVRKLGERVLPEIIPILESGLDSNQPDQRQGVCIGLSEIMASTSKEHVSFSRKKNTFFQCCLPCDFLKFVFFFFFKFSY